MMRTYPGGKVTLSWEALGTGRGAWIGSVSWDGDGIGGIQKETDAHIGFYSSFIHYIPTGFPSSTLSPTPTISLLSQILSSFSLQKPGFPGISAEHGIEITIRLATATCRREGDLCYIWLGDYRSEEGNCSLKYRWYWLWGRQTLDCWEPVLLLSVVAGIPDSTHSGQDGGVPTSSFGRSEQKGNKIK